MLSRDEGINGVAPPRRVCHARHGRPYGPLKSPVLARIFRRRLIRRAGSLIDPRLEQADLFLSERRSFACRRHARPIVAGDGGDEQTLDALSGHDGRPMPATFADERRRIESQVRLLTQRAVAGIAARTEKRLDVTHIVHSFGRGRSRSSQANPWEESDSQVNATHGKRPPAAPQKESGRATGRGSRRGRYGAGTTAACKTTAPASKLPPSWF